MKIKFLFLSLICFVLTMFYACGKEKDAESAEYDALESYLAKFGDTCVVQDTLGIYLYVAVSGETNYSNGDVVNISFTGQTLENVVTFAQESTMQVVYGQNSLIKGWQIALSLLKKGSSGILIVPYDMGYGKSRQGVIEPYSTLVYSFTVN